MSNPTAAKPIPIVDYISEATYFALHVLGFKPDATGAAPGYRFVTITDAWGSFKVWARPA